MRWRQAVVVWFAASIVAGCASEGLVLTREPATVRLVAADSVGPLASILAERYESAHPWASVDVAVYNSGQAEAALRDGRADIAMLSWLDGEEGQGLLWSTAWTQDGILVVLHPATRLPGASLGHVQEVFRGRLQEWDGIVYTVISREVGSGTRNAFESIVMDYHGVTVNAVVASSSVTVIECVAKTPGAIGYVSSLRLTSEDLSSVRVLAVDGVPADRQAIADGSYVLWRQLYLATEGEPVGEARDFAQWVLGPEGQVITQRFASAPMSLDR